MRVTRMICCLLVAVAFQRAALSAQEKDDKLKGRAADETGLLSIKWMGSLAESIAFAKENFVPAMFIIYREDDAADMRKVKVIEGWPTLIASSHGHMAAYKAPVVNEDARALIARLKLKQFPAVIWLDQDANPVISTILTDTAATLTAVVKGWPQTLENINRFYSAHLIQGNKFLVRGKLRSAYLEYAHLAPFQGKDPDLARRGIERVRKIWLGLAQRAHDLPAGSNDRDIILKGLRRDTQFLDFSAKLEAAIAQGAPVAQAPRPEAPAAPAEAPPPAEPARPADPPPAAPQPDVKAPQPAAPPVMPATDDKALVDAMKVQVSQQAYASDKAEDSTINLAYLAAHKDQTVKDAGRQLQAALDGYRKALEVRELGGERNALLQKAATDFEQGIDALDKVVSKTPDAALDRVMQQVAMIMYACLKYQSL